MNERQVVVAGVSARAAAESAALAGYRVTAIDALVDPVNVDFVREFQLSCVNQPVPADFMERVIAESRKVPARVWKAARA